MEEKAGAYTQGVGRGSSIFDLVQRRRGIGAVLHSAPPADLYAVHMVQPYWPILPNEGSQVTESLL